MKEKVIRCIGILFLFASTLPAQSQNNSQSEQFSKGKQLFLQGQYEQAIEYFRPLSRTSQGNPYVEYASFYFGLSAFNEGQYDLAKNMFLQIRSKFPRWQKMAEVNYWLSSTYFELGEYHQALTLLQNMQNDQQVSKQMKQDIEITKAHYFAKSNIEQLQKLLANYPNDKTIATQLVKKIAGRLYDADQQILMDSLVEVFNIDMATLGVATQESSVKKEVYNVAVLLPFLYDQLNPETPQQGNQFIIDLYKGMKMAVQDLRSEGIAVQLHAYDTERSQSKTKDLLQQQEMSQMDVLIGPLYPGPYQEASKFAMENQKYLFNPLSSNPAAIGDNPFAYLMKPSLITEGKIAAQFAIDSLKKNQAVVITGESGRDSLRVSSFISVFEESGERNVVILEEENFNRERIEELVEMLNEFGEDNLLYVASDDELIISNTISAVVMAENKIPIIGSEEWLDASSITFDQLENFEEYLIAPGYINPENEAYKDFKEQYRRTYFDIPNKYTFAGYDLMMYIGNMLNKYGVYFQEFYTNQKVVNSLLYAGYNYGSANDNQLVPIIKYEEGQLRLVNVQP